LELRKNSGNQDIDNLINSSEQNIENTGFEVENDNFIKSNYTEKRQLINNKENTQKKSDKKKIVSKWGDDEEEDEDVDASNVESTGHQKNVIDLTIKEEESSKVKFRNSDVPSIQTVLGNFTSLKKLLQNQLGIMNANPLKNIIKNIYLSSYSHLRLSPCGEALELVLKSKEMRGNDDISLSLPSSCVSLRRIKEILEEAFECVDNKEEEEEIKDTLFICTEYIIMMKLDSLAEENRADKFLCSQIRLLITLCQVPKCIHKFLILKRAKIATKNAKNYLSTGGVLYKMLALEQNLTEYKDLGFDKLLTEYNSLKEKGNEKDYPFNIKELEKKPSREIFDFVSLELLNSSEKISFSICCASYKEEMANQLCSLCGLTTLGKEVTGLKLIDEFIKFN
jgi:hypothetical protein